MLIPEFDFDPRTRVLFGAGMLSRLSQEVIGYGGTRVLLVSDKGLKEVGHESRAVKILSDAGLHVEVFDEVHPNPTTLDIELGTAFAKDQQIDFIVGLGGGSSMDCAKGINFLLTNGGRMQDYHGVGKATKPMLPMIAIPTTSGTGSEAQSYAVIADPDTHMKMACGDKKAAARLAILDPELTVTMPKAVTAVTGIDAISHALESFVTTKRGPVSSLFGRQAWQLLNNSFIQVLTDPHDIDARGAMLLGAHLAGSAIENSMLGATHSLANPLSAHFGLTHGVVIGILLPHVIRFNAEVPDVRKLYGILAADVGLCKESDPSAGQHLAKRVQDCVRTAELPTALIDCDVDEMLIPVLAQEAAKQWTAQFNPRPVDPISLEKLYRCAFHNNNNNN